MYGFHSICYVRGKEHDISYTLKVDPSAVVVILKGQYCKWTMFALSTSIGAILSRGPISYTKESDISKGVHCNYVFIIGLMLTKKSPY